MGICAYKKASGYRHQSPHFANLPSLSLKRSDFNFHQHFRLNQTRDYHRCGRANGAHRVAKYWNEFVHQIDISDYRDTIGHPMKNNIAFMRAQAIADEFCVTHGDICTALDRHDDDGLDAAVQHLMAKRQEASPAATPPEYRTWTTGP